MLDNGELSDLHDFIINLKDYRDFRASSFSIARKYNSSKSIKDANNQAYTIGTPIEMFKHNGPAVYLYFLFLKRLCLAFAFFSILALPSLLSNFKGDGLEYGLGEADSNIQFKLTEFLMRFSLANENQQIALNSVNHTSWMVSIWGDFLISLLLLVFIIYWAVELEHSTQLALAQRGLPSYYTVIIERLPPAYSESSIRECFGQFGQVVEISTVKKVSNIHIEMLKIQMLLDRLLKEKDGHRMYKIYIRLVDEYRRLRMAYRKLEESCPVAAFISFDQMKSKNYVLDLAKTQKLVYEGEQVRVSNCNIQPANILWNNFHIDQQKHTRRSALLWVLIVLIFAGGMTLLFFVRVHANVGEGLEMQRRSVDYTIEQVIALNSPKITYYFCYKQGLQGFFRIQIHQICEEFYARYTRHIILIFKGSSIIIALNLLLNLLFSYLADYRRYPTVTSRNVFLIISRSFTIFVTNVLLMLFLECEIGGLAPRQLFEWVFRVKREHKLYEQFSRKWYLDIGAQIIMTYLMSVVLFPLTSLGLNYLRKIGRYVHARTKRRQGDMNKAYLDPEFDFNGQYCDILNAVFTCMTFSCGLPILYPLCCLALFIIFWTSKITLIKLSRQPAPSDHTLNEMIARILPASLFIHSFMSRYFLSSRELFPHPSKIPVISMAIIMLLTAVYFRFRKDILLSFRRYRLKSTMDGLIFQEDKSLSKLLQTRKKFLYSYRMQDNPEYSNVFYIITLLDLFQKKRRAEMEGKAKSEYRIPRFEEGQTEDGRAKGTHRRLVKMCKQSVV